MLVDRDGGGQPAGRNQQRVLQEPGGFQKSFAIDVNKLLNDTDSRQAKILSIVLHYNYSCCEILFFQTNNSLSTIQTQIR
jgi:hypothetical protein